MKKVIIFMAGLSVSVCSMAMPPIGYCDVVICNKIERISFNPWSHIKDKFGEQCFPQILSAEYAERGRVLDAGTRFYQGSFNPTKRSVTRVKKVLQCTKEQRNAE